jgi:hypothetical protein
MQAAIDLWNDVQDTQKIMTFCTGTFLSGFQETTNFLSYYMGNESKNLETFGIFPQTDYLLRKFPIS